MARVVGTVRPQPRKVSSKEFATAVCDYVRCFLDAECINSESHVLLEMMAMVDMLANKRFDQLPLDLSPRMVYHARLERIATYASGRMFGNVTYGYVSYFIVSWMEHVDAVTIDGDDRFIHAKEVMKNVLEAMNARLQFNIDNERQIMVSRLQKEIATYEQRQQQQKIIASSEWRQRIRDEEASVQNNVVWYEQAQQVLADLTEQ